MNEAHLEQKIQDFELNAPRVTPGDLDAAIDSVDYVKHVTHLVPYCVGLCST